MSDLDHEDEEDVVVNGVDNAVVAGTDTAKVTPHIKVKPGYAKFLPGSRPKI